MSDPKGISASGPGDALLVVDVQTGFQPGGALGVTYGERVVPPLSRLLRAWRERGWTVYSSRDRHPSVDCSFAALGGPWPVHCAGGSPWLTAAAERVDREFP